MSDVLAKKFGGLVVMGEHRYFGDTKPFGEHSLDKGNVQFLTLENILMDNARLIEVVKQRFDAQNQPVVVFGGSYSGQVAAWMRMKFPSLVQAGVVSGAPILYYKDS